MKKTILAICLIGVVAVGGTLAYRNLTTAPAAAPVVGQSDTVAPARQITAAEVAQHATAADCWTIVHGQVYDVTSLISRHSGGAEVITANCGRDGSETFDTKGKQPPREHSQRASAMMEAMRVGALAVTP